MRNTSSTSVKYFVASEEDPPLPLTILRKFLKAGPIHVSNPSHSFHAFRRELYFFYGTLMDPATLAKVLSLRAKPVLLPAKILGYHYVLWGQYPALLDGPLDALVHGMAYEAQSHDEVALLEAYETNHYRTAACGIDLGDGAHCGGRTFLWNSERRDLKEGVFDLKDWQMDNLERDVMTGLGSNGA